MVRWEYAERSLYRCCFFSSRRRHTRSLCDWSSDVCSSDLFNVLHPMGYDSFGLPAEQYAIQTGQHPAITTEANIATYRRQLDQIGFSFDWSREVRTSSPDYYKWTQWIFMQLFNSWYNRDADKAESIDNLVKHFEAHGSAGVNAVCDDEVLNFSADE